MSVVTLKKKTLAQYKTQNNMVSDKKEVSYCSGTCRSGRVDHPAYLDVNQTFTGNNTFTTLPQSSATPSSSTDLVTKNYADNVFGASYNLNLTGSINVSSNSNYKNATIRITSTGEYTVTIPSPNVPILNNTIQTYVNDSTNTITLSIGSGVFSGKYGSGTTSLILPANTWVTIYSTGTNWNVNDKTISYYNPSFAITGNTTISSNYLNSYITLSGNASYTITLPTAANSNGSYLEIENLNIKTSGYYTLLSSSGFQGTYGTDGSTNLILPPQSKIKLISNGTSWLGVDISNYGWVYPFYITGSSPEISYKQFFRTYTNNINNSTGNCLWQLKSPPPPRWEGLVFNLVYYYPNNSGNPTFTITSTWSPPYFTPVPVLISQLSGSNVRMPYTATSVFTKTGNSNSALTVVRTSVSSGLVAGTITGTNGRRNVTLNINANNSVNIGTIISDGSANYTITGMSRSSFGTFSGISGSSDISLNDISGGSAYVQTGMAINVSGGEHLIIGYPVANSNGGVTNGGTVAVYPPLTANYIAGSSYTTCTGVGVPGAGVYTISPHLAVDRTSQNFTIVQDAFAWNNGPF